MDTIKITILDDGRFKLETDAVSMPNHGNAEMLFREMARLGGGETERKRKSGHAHAHTHTHGGITHTH